MAAAILTTVFIVGCAPATQPATPVAGTSGPTSGAADATVDTPTSEVPDGTKTADTTASPGAEETVTAAAIDSFESCVAAGRPVMESYPRQCRGPDGELYVEDIGNEVEMLDTIRVDTPRPGASVTSPVTVAGEARGTWYFEASFPVRLVSRDGETLAVVPATAQGEWMTEEFVPFEAALDLDPEFAGYTGPARLILEKANPSGLEEHAASLNFPVEIIP